VRKSVVATGVVVASLALAACGSSPAAKKAALDQYIASLGASPDVQLHLTAGFTGAGSTAKIQGILKMVSLDVNVSNNSGAPVSQAGTSANTELIFNVGSTHFLDVRLVNGAIYLKIDVTAISQIPGVKLPASEVSAAQLFFGGRWFELPKELLHSIVQRTKVPKAQIATDQQLEAKILDAITKLIVTGHYKTLSNGFSESGTLQSVAAAVTPTIQQFAHTSSTSKPVKGTYVLVLTTSGSSVTGASVSITAPSGTKGNATGTLTATVTHKSVNVVAPSGATPITTQLLKDFGLSKVAGG
jgi:hypothetical protein